MLRAIDHINLAVRGLPLMTRFYEEFLGLKVTKRVTISGEWVENVVGLKGVLADVVYLEFPSGPRIELIKYRSPEDNSSLQIEPPNAGGIRHIAFRVDEIDAMVDRLTQAGVKFFSTVQDVPDSQVQYAGGVRKRLVYFRDPEGNILELCEYKSATNSSSSPS
jgi:catechol 2,3-dioxygenase-like lactoylglutathione lyase family enzyme